MVTIHNLVNYLNSTLEIERFSDSSLNGLQLEGALEVTRIAVSVDASVQAAEEAKALGANMLLVHHGMIWDKTFAITGRKKAIIKFLLDANISLYAAHLPLDANQSVGNNFGLGRLLSLSNLSPCFNYHGQDIGVIGDNDKNTSLIEIVKTLKKLPGAERYFHVLDFGPSTPKRVGIVSGGGIEGLFECGKHNIDTFITGEPSQKGYHFAQEEKLNVIFAGHYATETVGIIEMAKLIETKFAIPWNFINIPTGI